MTMHNAPTLPVTLADPHRDVTPHCYVVWHKPQLCTNCGTLHSHSELYAKTHLRSSLGLGKYVTNLRPLDIPRFNLPIEIIQAPPRPIPFCAECYDRVDLSALPSPPLDAPRSANLSLCGTGDPFASREPKRPKGAARMTATRTPTLDDLKF